MKHQTFEQLQGVAEVNLDLPSPAMTRAERVDRWARLLENQPERQLGTLHGTEYEPAETRDMMRAEGSPITVAFDDPALRAAGLKDDTYGEAKRFFELTDWQLHNVVCHCHVGEAMKAAVAADRLRWATRDRQSSLARLWSRFFQ